MLVISCCHGKVPWPKAPCGRKSWFSLADTKGEFMMVGGQQNVRAGSCQRRELTKQIFNVKCKAERADKLGVERGCELSKPTPSAGLPPEGLCLLKVKNFPQTEPTGYQGSYIQAYGRHVSLELPECSMLYLKHRYAKFHCLFEIQM